jgi:hypothetical protein
VLPRRCPTCCLSSLSMSHCGLDDKDGSLILDSLVPDETSSISSSLCGSSSGGCAQPHAWTFLDLSHNMLEGGTALCAATLVSVTCSSRDWGRTQQQQQQQGAADTFFCSTSSSGAASRGSRSSGFKQGNAFDSSSGVQQLGQQALLLDGNPLGASGVRSIMRALAGQLSVGMFTPASSSSRSAAAGSGLSSAPSTSSSSDCLLNLDRNSSTADLEGVLRSGAAACDTNQTALQQQQQPLRLHVGIAKVALMAKERGFRSSMRDTQSAVMLTAQVRLVDPIAPGRSKLVGWAQKGYLICFDGSGRRFGAARVLFVHVMAQQALGLCSASSICSVLRQHGWRQHINTRVVRTGPNRASAVTAAATCVCCHSTHDITCSTSQRVGSPFRSQWEA